jgi:hypothetical protein
MESLLIDIFKTSPLIVVFIFFLYQERKEKDYYRNLYTDLVKENKEEAKENIILLNKIGALLQKINKLMYEKGCQ